MLSPNLFEGIQYDSDPFWVVKEFLNTLSGHYFYWGLNHVTNGQGCGTEHAGCVFPTDGKDEDEEIHDGVYCYYFDDSVVISEEDFRSILKVACERYIFIYPNCVDKKHIQAIIDKMK
ncbi:ribonuclease toxin immunity protein CdiI [Chamaesiphon sp. VAR_48_metabat_403]|uniref:ribonuclease toxin immunity protein CdiI n=1 Tax=Chamaesiphon sp. VAR_48_metabat_403 TaxID=2964700 RepID=UPI00286DB353|nr:ribonuclease toxin immunity protein CdiI [Chamaesiphon sp. VAR_48_metabat_403]